MADTAQAAPLAASGGTRWLRRWSDAMRLALCATGCVLVLGGRASAAIGVAFISATAIAARLPRAPAGVESAFVTLLALDVWLTTSGAMARIDRHDIAGHLILTAAVTPLLAVAIGRVRRLSHRSTWETSVCAGLAAAVLAVGWEIVEWSSDVLLGTYMSLSATDTAYDLTSGLLGATAGAVIAARIGRPQR